MNTQFKNQLRKSILVVMSVMTLMSFVNTAKASQVFASSYGYNSTNATTAFQAAIQSANDTIIVDLQTNDWNVAPSSFFNLSNKTIIFQSGVTLKAIPGLFNATNACLLRFNDCSNLTLIGYSVTLKMNKSEYAILNDSEHRNSINLWSCSNITIKGFVIDESGGDGIYIGGDGTNFCQNIFVEDVQCINHYRQGMSITNVENMTARHCYFANTQGTLPEAGVDVEPYQTNQRIVNLNIEYCRFENNGWAGLAFALFELDSTSLPVSITVIDCVFKSNNKPTNSYADCEIYFSADDNSPVQGNIVLERCYIQESDYTAVYTRKTHDSITVTFKDCVFQNVSKLQIPFNEPIFLEVPDYSNPSDYLGGLFFDNVLIAYNTNFSFFRVYGFSTLAGLKDVIGNFTIVEPNGNAPMYNNVPVFVNVTYTYNNQTSLPPVNVALNNIQNTAIECDSTSGVFSVSRTSSNVNYPLGLSYQNAGSATFGDDIHYFPLGMILPTNQTSVTQSITAMQDNIIEPMEFAEFIFQSSPLYSIIGGDTISTEIYDCNLLNINDIKDNQSILVYPNPATDFISVSISDGNKFDIIIHNTYGRVVYSKSILSSEKLQIDEFVTGIYFLTILDERGQRIKNIKIIKL